MKIKKNLLLSSILILTASLSTANSVGISFEEDSALLPSPPGIIYQEDKLNIRWLGTAADSISEYRVYLTCKGNERKYLGSKTVKDDNKGWYFFVISGYAQGCTAEISSVDHKGLEGQATRAVIIEEKK